MDLQLDFNPEWLSDSTGFPVLQPVRECTGVIVSVSSFVSPLADQYPALSNVQSLKTIISHTLFSFILVSDGRVNLVSVTLSWLEEDFYLSSNGTRQISNPKYEIYCLQPLPAPKHYVRQCLVAEN